MCAWQNFLGEWFSTLLACGNHLESFKKILVPWGHPRTLKSLVINPAVVSNNEKHISIL